MIAATRQDMQTALDRMKSSILGNMMSRGDTQALATSLRSSILQDLHELHAENQLIMKQSYAQRQQLFMKVASLENQLNGMQQVLIRLVDQQARLLSALQR